MPSLRVLVATVMLACIAPAASAQQTIQQRMTAEEFRAAGLDRLSAGELANLNRWLQQQPQPDPAAAAEQAIAQARAEGREQAQREAAAAAATGAAGRRAATPSEPVQSRIAGDFSGFARGRRYTLENGQVWEQTDASRLDGVRISNPAVTVAPGFFGVWYLRIDGYNTRAKVQRVD